MAEADPATPEAASDAPAEVAPAAPAEGASVGADAGTPLDATPAPGPPPAGDVGAPALFAAVLLIATCGLIYELVSGAMASYLLGDSITQFSLVIGFYLSAMGLGSYLSKFVRGDLLWTFLRVEVAIGVVGGFSAVILLAAYAYLGEVQLILLGQVAAIGTLVGLEIPLLMRVLKDQVAFADLIARVLAFDYLGALAASLLFPLLLMPLLGLPRTAFLFGLLNGVVALVLAYVFRRRLGPRARAARFQALGALALLGVGFVMAERWALAAEQHIYDAPVLFKRKTHYQTITVTRWREDVRLLLDGHLQFCSLDERRYHEALVHPAAASLRGPLKHALVLGGGDGLALRELLRYPSLETATLVDLDPAMTGLFSSEPLLLGLNERSFLDPRVTVANADAMTWLEEHPGTYDLVVIDFPDPRSHALAKLYTWGFYRLVRRHLSEAGAVVVQATSPAGPPDQRPRRGAQAYWCVVATLEDAGFTVRPFHAYVPSFGEWGFALALPTDRPAPTRPAPGLDGLTYLNDDALAALFAWPEDLKRPDGVEVNRLDEQILVHYYEGDE